MRVFFIRQDLQDEHDKSKPFELLGELNNIDQLNPGYPVRTKKNFLSVHAITQAN